MTSAQNFIKEEFEKRRARNPNFSLRSYAKWLDVSPAQLSQMMTGKRSVTPKTLQKIVKRIGLSPFEKKQIFNSLLKDKNFIESEDSKKINLEEDKFRVISDWYHLAIVSLAHVKGAKADPRWISSRLGISMEEAHGGLLRLERLGIISTKPKFKQISPPFEVVSDVPSEAIRKYHKQNLSLAIEKIDTVPVSARQFQSISLVMDTNKVQKLEKLLNQFLDEVMEQFHSEESNEVYNLNVQLFPLTKLKETEK
jgi:uncharacterized protein (TIGR02147 family)